MQSDEFWRWHDWFWRAYDWGARLGLPGVIASAVGGVVVAGYFRYDGWDPPIVLLAALGAFAALAAIYLAFCHFLDRRNPRSRSLQYLNNRDTALAPAVVSMAFESAWARWFAAQHLVNNKTPILRRYLIMRAGEKVMNKILDGDLEVCGRKPRQMDFEAIPRTHWRSSTFLVFEDPLSLWRVEIAPKGDVQLSPDGFESLDATMAERNSQISNNYDSLLIDAYKFENFWPKSDPIADRKRCRFLRKAKQLGLDRDEIRRLS